MDDLEIPEQFAGIGVDGHERGAEEVIAGTVDADTIIVGRAEGHVEDAARHIDRHVTPDVDS